MVAVAGQRRTRRLSETLRLAERAAVRARVTRLGDVTGLGGLDVPTFQAVRPMALSLSVSQGKGLGRTAAMVSALLEAVELDVAERHPPPSAPKVPLAALDRETIDLWSMAPRDPLAVRLNPDVARLWSEAHDLRSGAARPVPWELLSLDFTRPALPDALPSSVGLATGNSRTEALCAAVAELIEHDLIARFDRLFPGERRVRELDLTTIDHPLADALIRRIAAQGFAVRAWSLGQRASIAAFHCALYRPGGVDGDLPPATGSGCHADRGIALLRALLEAAQSRATLVAGARDDLIVEDYHHGARRQLELILARLSFTPGPLRWDHVPHASGATPEDDLETLLRSAESLTPLPLLAVDHPQPVPGLHIVHVLAPGLIEVERARATSASEAPPAPKTRRPARSQSRPVLFVGPSLDPREIPASIDARPPAICGDLTVLLDDPPPAVGLIDGFFNVAPTVWHKEILDLLAHGIPVLGAASLGAIRAVELNTLGMQGVGTIFDAYRAGMIVRDDAVMLHHAPRELGYRPLTVALVDAEAALWRAPLTARDRRVLQRIVRTTPYGERRWDDCLADFETRTGRPAPIDTPSLEKLATLKREDAQALVATLTGGTQPEMPAPERPPLTGFYRRLEREIRGQAPPAALPG